MSNTFIIPGIREPGTRPERKQRGTELSWAAPIDNEHVRGISIVAWALENGAPKLDCEHSNRHDRRHPARLLAALDPINVTRDRRRTSAS